MRYLILLFLISSVASLLVTGCGSDPQMQKAAPTTPESTANEEGLIKLNVSFAPWKSSMAKPAGAAAINKVTVYVYDSSSKEIVRQDLTISGGRASGRITVEAQDNLRVVLVYLDGSIVRYIGEDSDVDVPAGGETTADIVEHYMGTSVAAPNSADVGKDYVVSWMERAYATDYELQEATQANFSGATTVYQGGNTSFTVPGKPAAAITYYYRARANTDYGYGPWHSTGDASTGIVALKGTIIIDVPLPPEHGEVATFSLPGGATIEMVWIESGIFMMGSPDTEADRQADEGPQHEVTITKGFYLGEYELTQGQWEAVMGTTPWSGQSHVQENPDHPAVYISWEDVQAFVAKLNEVEGKEVYRLPTEAEWEYACRAGTTTRWSLGDDESQLADYAWYAGNAWGVGENYAHQVGTKLPNPWGLYDMHGNVYEWCQDWYGTYLSGAQTDPMGPSTGSDRVIRGAAFNNLARLTRSADRDYYSPDALDGDDIGARLLRQGP